MEERERTRVYDLFDRVMSMHQSLIHLAERVDPIGTLPHSLQSILGKVYRYEGSSAVQIARIYGIDEKNTIKYIGDLEQRGLVYKKREGRRRAVYLTEEGQRVNHQLMAVRDPLIEEILSSVGIDRLDTLIPALDRVVEAIDALEGVHDSDKSLL